MSSSARRRPEQVLFVDRDAWSVALGAALDAAGISYVAHHDRFKPDTPDEQWLAAAGREHWVVLTRDQNIRRRPAELAAFKAAKVVVFVLSQGNLSATETATIVTGAYARMMRMAKGARRPALFTLLRSGQIQRLEFR